MRTHVHTKLVCKNTQFIVCVSMLCECTLYTLCAYTQILQDISTMCECTHENYVCMHTIFF